MADPTTPQADPGAASAPGFDLAQVFQKLQDQAQTEMSAAQQQRGQLLDEADKRARSAQLFGTPEVGLALRDRLTKLADRPVAEVLERHAARENAVKEAIDQGRVAAQGWQNEQLLKQMDPQSDLSQAVRAHASKMGIQLPETVSAFSAGTLNPVLKQLAESYAARAGGAEKEATAARTRALTSPEVEKTRAETVGTLAGAGKTAAETHKIELETGKGPAPDWVPTGEIGATDKDRADFGEAWKSNDAVHKTVDEIKSLVDGHDFIADPGKRAQIQPRVATLMASLKGQLGMARLAGPEMHFLETMSADPTKITPANLLGYAKNGVRLESFKDLSDRELQTQAAGKFRYVGKDQAHTRFAGGEGKGAPTVVERRTARDGRKLEKLSDGTIRVAK